jgi:hypothetical protein
VSVSICVCAWLWICVQVYNIWPPTWTQYFLSWWLVRSNERNYWYF